MSAVPGAFVLADAAAVADLRTFVQRARRVDAQGAVRLVAVGDVLAAYTAALHGPGLPTVLALRLARLAEPCEADVTVELTALSSRFARLEAVGPGAGPVELPVPPVQLTSVAWAGVTPPRSGWAPAATLTDDQVRACARAGIEAVATAGPLDALSIRTTTWGAAWADGAGAPTGAAFGAHAFGFVPPAPSTGVATVHRLGPWWRLSTARGHVLARRSMLG